MSPGMQKVEDGCPGASDMKKSRRRGSKAEPHHRRASLTSLQSTTPMSRQRGFSLVELLFALLILSIVITTSLAVFVERTNRAQQAAELILAYQVLANEAEAVRRMAYSSLDGLTDNFKTGTNLIQPLQPFQTTVDVSLARPDVKMVTLTIRWRANREASVTLLRTDTGGSNLW